MSRKKDIVKLLRDRKTTLEKDLVKKLHYKEIEGISKCKKNLL